MSIYVYAHCRPEARESCFYVGKGCANRSTSRGGRNARWLKTVGECGGFRVRIIGRFSSHDEALAHEEEIIYLLREMGAELTNIHAGGSRGAAGTKFSEEHRRKIGDAHRGKKLSPERRRRIGDFRRGKTTSDAQKAAAAQSCRARNSTPEQIERVKAFLTGRPRTEEERRRMSEAQKARFAARPAPPQSEETRRKRAESVRISWIARRERTAAKT